MNRREFVLTSTAAGIAAAAQARPAAQAPAVSRGRVKPVVISSANGHQLQERRDEDLRRDRVRADDRRQGRPRRPDRRRQHRRARSAGGRASATAALPNADGVVQLDSCCMHGPKKRAGGVACLEGVRTPSLVAQKVMDQTDHHLIVGKDAQAFARSMGFTIEADLNTERSRNDVARVEAPDPTRCTTSIRSSGRRRCARSSLDMMAEGWIDPKHFYGTINCNGINAAGEICGVTTTSGLAWKIPGRVGDSPILGAGLYVDGERRRRRIDRTRRGQPLQPVLVPDRRGDAPRQAPEGRRHGSAEAHQGEHGREAAAELARRCRTSTSTSTC